MAIPIVLGTILLADRFIVTVYKTAFLPAGGALSVLVWILILSGSNLIFANALVASNNQRINLEGNLISMALNIFLNLLLIPRFSFMGAAIASLSSSVMLIVYQYWFVSKKLFKIDYVRIIMKPSISACAMGVFIMMYKEINLYVLIPISALVYVVAILALKTFTSRISVIYKIFHGRKGVDVRR
jgi:O-antigen/teichoic acid export membrane protein